MEATLILKLFKGDKDESVMNFHPFYPICVPDLSTAPFFTTIIPS